MNVGNRIRQARVSAGMSVQNVSATVGVSRNAVYKWERGEDVPRQSIIIKLARLFDVDTDFFFREVYVTMCTPAYRRKASLAKKAQDCVEARIALELEKQLFVDSLFPEREFPQVSAGSYRVWSLSDVEIAADELRTSWGLGLDPIGSVISAVEEHGVRVVVIDGVEGFDGFSCFANGSMPVIAIPAGMPGDRQRSLLRTNSDTWFWNRSRGGRGEGRSPVRWSVPCSAEGSGQRTRSQKVTTRHRRACDTQALLWDEHAGMGTSRVRPRHHPKGGLQVAIPHIQCSRLAQGGAWSSSTRRTAHQNATTGASGGGRGFADAGRRR